jgi:hypothetical protein
VIHLLEGQHNGLDVLLAGVGTRLDGWTDDADSADGEALATVLQLLVAALYEHMGLEEKLALPLVERHIFAAEWEEMVAAEAAAVLGRCGPADGGSSGTVDPGAGHPARAGTLARSGAARRSLGVRLPA